MKTNLIHFRSMATAIATLVVLVGSAFAALADVTTQLEPGEIALGQSAQFTITTSGNGGDTVSPPAVPGLEFVAVGQSSQTESINGVTSSTVSDSYEVIPQRAGTFTIPALSPGSQQLVLYVRPSAGNGGAATGNSLGAPSLPPAAASGLSSGPTSLTPDGAAFVRLRLPKSELYVGETVPVDIQVGARAGMVAAINGLPTLNGDAFMLNKLSSQPEQSEEDIDGQAYTVYTWHSALAVVKPGDFSLSVETPLTVRIRTAARRRMPVPNGMFNDPMFDQAFNDPFFQNFFGGTTEKEISVSSPAQALKVLPLPTAGQPAGFDGAVGNFEVAGELSAEQCSAGDPLTLRLRVTGTGNFDRVNTSMLGHVEGWKTYPPTAKFAPADSASYSGEKDFEQAVIPMQPGRQTVPAMALNFFNPDTRRYETKLTAPLSVEVSPAPGGGLNPGAVAASSGPSSASPAPRQGLRPDHVEAGGTVATLLPLYFQPWFVAGQSALAVGFAGGLIFLRRQQRRAQDADGTRRREASGAIASCLTEMEAASVAGDAARFFQCARAALQEKLATRWRVAAGSITIAEIDARLNGQGAAMRRVFALADQASYSGQQLGAGDFQQWKEIVRDQLERAEDL